MKQQHPTGAPLPGARPRPDRRFAVVAVLAVLAIVLGLFGPSAWARVTGNSGSPNTSAKDRIEAHPPPTLFSTTAVAATASDVAAQQKRAAAMFRPWVTAHGTATDDKAFVAWLEKAFPAPPATLADEMPKVVALSKTRTSAGIAAATWLESYGKKDVWKLYVHDQREVLPASAGKDRKAEVKAELKMS